MPVSTHISTSGLRSTTEILHIEHLWCTISKSHTHMISQTCFSRVQHLHTWGIKNCPARAGCSTMACSPYISSTGSLCRNSRVCLPRREGLDLPQSHNQGAVSLMWPAVLQYAVAAKYSSMMI